MKVKKMLVLLCTLPMIVGGVVTAAPASAAVNANCSVWIESSTGQAGQPIRRPAINCLSVTGGQARGRADCTAAPDTYTAWVRSYQSSMGASCLFGARGAILQTREG
jgi:hypothetical protein